MCTKQIHIIKQQALNQLHANHLAEAQALFTQVCEMNAEDVDAWYYLSSIHGMLGNMDEAGRCSRRVIVLNPDHSDAHVNMGNVLLCRGKIEHAVQHYQTALRSNPNNAGALCSLGNALAALDLHDEAAANFQAALRLNANLVEAYYNLGNSQFAQKQYADAMDSFRHAIRLNPNYVEARKRIEEVLDLIHREAVTQQVNDITISETATNNPQQQAIHSYSQGVLYEKQGNHEEAIRHYQQAIAVKSDFAEAYNNLGTLLMWQGRSEDALQSFQKTIELNPDSIHAHNNIGIILTELGHLHEATTTFQQAIALDPNHPQPYVNLARVLINLNNLEGAASIVERALQIDPDFSEAYVCLASILITQGRARTCIEILEKSLKLKPDNMLAASALLFCVHYLSDYSSEDLSLTAKIYAACFNSHGQHLSPIANLPDPRRRLRVGYVSGDFYDHPIGYFIESVLSHHDNAHYEIFCYYNHKKHDEYTTRIQQSANHWRNIGGRSDSGVMKQIHEDNIDILIDLSGHTGRNRLSVFTHKPAPIQVTWLGYFDTTGLDSIDYIIGDRFLIPSEEERHYTERVIRLPNAYLSFSPPDVAIDPGPLPALATGKITFGCFNNPAKITEAVIACWSRLLNALPQAQLYLKYKTFDDFGVWRRYIHMFAQHGITSGRIRFSGFSPRMELLDAYHEVDIALDPYPYNGGTTTMEALWMGVPLITLCGDRYVSHVGETILKNLDLTEYVTDSEEAYISKAIALASDLPRLAELRGELRNRLLNSPLCDGPGFTRDLEVVYRQMWEAWCQINHNLP